MKRKILIIFLSIISVVYMPIGISSCCYEEIVTECYVYETNMLFYGYFIFEYDSENNYCLAYYMGSNTDLALPELTDTNGNKINYSIKQYVFSNCTALTSIAIPDNVTSIGDYAFSGCTSLTNVYYCGSVEEWSKIIFSNNKSDPTYYGATIYYYSESQPDYSDGYNYWHYVDGEIVVWTED